MARHPGACGTQLSGEAYTRDPERVAYLDRSLESAIRAYLAAAPPDLFSKRG